MDAEASEATEYRYFWVCWVFQLGWVILDWIGMGCIHRLYYERLVEILFRGDAGSYHFSTVCLQKLPLYMMAGRIGKIGLLLAGWYGQIRQTRQDGGEMQGQMLEGAGSGTPPLAIDVWREAGSVGCHQFYRCCRGGRVFVSVQKNNYNTLHTTPNFNILNDSTKSTYNTIVL